MPRSIETYLFPEPPRDGWERTALTAEQERRFNWAATLVVGVFIVGWIYAIGMAIEADEPLGLGQRVSVSPFSPTAPPEAAFLVQAAMRELVGDRLYLGESGAVRLVVPEPGEVPPDTIGSGVEVDYQAVDGAGAETRTRPDEPGVWNLLLRLKDVVREVPRLSVATLVPLSEVREGRIGRYVIGEWPTREERPARFRTPAYDAPKGLVRVTRANQNILVSEHLRLRDFLTKGQEDVWPKYVAVVPRLLDKLELTFQELEAMGHPVEEVGVISGFRTPHYNQFGGDPSGRGALSRHTYGDAMDFYVDNDRDGRMDDLDGNGEVDIDDARVIARAAERVERDYPHLVGGIGTYAPNPGSHAGFVHVDTRGYRARW